MRQADPRPVSSPDSPALRQAAEAVAERLKAIAATFAALGPEHRHAGYADFASLYAQTTTAWLGLLAAQPERDYPLRVIPPFFDLYHRHVLENLDAPLPAIAPHWRRYHALTRSLGPDARMTARLIALAHGVRAHTHKDLGDVMHALDHQGSRANRRWMFDELASRAFAEASRASLNAGLVRRTERLWLPVLHHWRASGYRQALRAEVPHGHAAAGGSAAERARLAP